MTSTYDTDDRSQLRAEIPTQGDALRGAAAALRAPVEQLATMAAQRGADDWVVTGCGDSLFAGQCAEVWFAQQTDQRLRAVHALELARYLYPTLGPRSIVLAVSHSGTTARVIEAALAAREAGAYVVAVTANADSELSEIADLTIDNTVRDEVSNTRTRSFQAVALFMRMIADMLNGGLRLDHYEALAAAVEDYVPLAEAQVAALPYDVIDANHWTFVGAGLGLAMTEYGKAKFYEAATLAAHAEELEQFIHCEIFTLTNQSVVVISVPSGAASSRAQELACGLAKLEARTIGLTNDPELARSCRYAVALPEDLDERDLPFLLAVAQQWLALRVALHRGENPDLVANKWVNRPLIDHSARWTPPSRANASHVESELA